MTKKQSYYKTGIFVIAGFCILALFLFIMGARAIFTKPFMIETYFDESIQGLDVGSLVKYRGVAVGNVKEISFVQEEYALQPDNPKISMGRYVLVRMGIRDVFGVKTGHKELIQKMIDNGLRVKVAAQGLTGTSYLEIDYVNAEANPVEEINWEPKTYYLPSTKSTFSKIGASIDELIKKLDKVEVDKIIKNLNQLVLTIDKTLNESMVSDLSKNTVGLLMEIRQTNQEIKKILSSPGVQGAPAKLDETLSNMNKSMQKLNLILSSNRSDIAVTMENLRLVSEDLREISANAKKDPSMFILREAPGQSIVGKK